MERSSVIEPQTSYLFCESWQPEEKHTLSFTQAPWKDGWSPLQSSNRVSIERNLVPQHATSFHCFAEELLCAREAHQGFQFHNFKYHCYLVWYSSTASLCIFNDLSCLQRKRNKSVWSGSSSSWSLSDWTSVECCQPTSSELESG